MKADLHGLEDSANTPSLKEPSSGIIAVRSRGDKFFYLNGFIIRFLVFCTKNV